MIKCALSPSVLAADLQREGFAIDGECGVEQQTVLGFIAAVALFCAKPYRGLGAYDKDEFPRPFEEERLRRLYAMAVGKGGNLVSSVAKRWLKEQIKGGQTPRSLQSLALDAQLCAEKLGLEGLPADLLFALCLATLEGGDTALLLPPYRAGRFSAPEAVASCSEGIEDYVIGKIEKYKEQLDEKIKKAVAIRDWRPALPVGSEEELAALLEEFYRFEYENGVLTLLLKGFFSEEDLKIRIVYRDGCYIFCDEGAALRALSKRVAGKEACLAMAKKILAGTICQIEGEMLCADGEGFVTFEDFLQYVILVAHADLIAEHYRGDEQYEEYPPLLPLVSGSEGDPRGLEEAIRSLMYIRYDEQLGTLFHPALCFLGNQTGTVWLLLTDGERITLRDHANSYDEGAVFEQYLAFSDALSPAFGRQIAPVLERFGVYTEGNKLILTCQAGERTVLCRALHRYMQAAVLLSQFGGAVPAVED